MSRLKCSIFECLAYIYKIRFITKYFIRQKDSFIQLIFATLEQERFVMFGFARATIFCPQLFLFWFPLPPELSSLYCTRFPNVALEERNQFFNTQIVLQA